MAAFKEAFINKRGSRTSVNPKEVHPSCWSQILILI